MPREISIPLPDGSKVKFDWEGEGEPSDEIKNQVLEQVGATKFGASIPKPPPQPAWISPVKTGAELTGLIGGAALGSPSGPIGAVTGAGLGYAGMKNATDYVLEMLGHKKPLSMIERLKQIGIDIPTGAATQATGEILPPLINTAGKIISYPWGAYTGGGATSIQEAYKGSPTFTEFMRNKGIETKAVGWARTGLDKLDEQRGLEYQDILNKLKNANFSFSRNDVMGKLNSSLKEYDLKFYPSGQVRWENTKFITNPKAQDEIDVAIKTVRNWGDYSPKGIDELKQGLDNLWKQSQPEASVFISNLRNKFKDLLIQNIPEYKQAMSKYKTTSEEIKEISKDLSMGDLNTKKQSLQKLLGMIKRDDEFGQELIDIIQKESGKDIKAALAGINMQSIIPSSLIGRMGGGMYALFRGLGMTPGEYIGLAASSPRLVGEFLNVVGKLARPSIKGSKYTPSITQSLIREKQD